MPDLTQHELEDALNGGRRDFTGMDLTGLALVSHAPLVLRDSCLDRGVVWVGEVDGSDISGVSMRGTRIFEMKVTRDTAERVDLTGATARNLRVLGGGGIHAPDLTDADIRNLAVQDGGALTDPVHNPATRVESFAVIGGRVTGDLTGMRISILHAINSVLGWCGDLDVTFSVTAHNLTTHGTKVPDVHPSSTGIHEETYTEDITGTFSAPHRMVSDVRFEGIRVDHLDLRHIDGYRFDLTDVTCPRLDLTGSVLERPRFIRARLAGGSFTGAFIMHPAVLGADFTGADFTRVTITGVRSWDDFAGAVFSDAISLARRGQLPTGRTPHGVRQLTVT